MITQEKNNPEIGRAAYFKNGTFCVNPVRADAIWRAAKNVCRRATFCVNRGALRPPWAAVRNYVIPIKARAMSRFNVCILRSAHAFNNWQNQTSWPQSLRHRVLKRKKVLTSLQPLKPGSPRGLPRAPMAASAPEPVCCSPLSASGLNGFGHTA